MEFNNRMVFNVATAIEAIRYNAFRSMLTALGIIFGVGAVIAMLSIGNGARQELLKQSKLVGANNIIITPVNEQTESELKIETKEIKKKYSPGLTMLDVESMHAVLPCIENLSAEVVLETHIIKDGIRRSTRLVGTTPNFFEISNFGLIKGEMFSQNHLIKGEQVCIIGKGINSRFFSGQEAIGKHIKVGRNWLKVIAVMEEIKVSKKAIEDLGIRDFNMDVYAPLNTVLRRYRNTMVVTKADLETSDDDEETPDKVVKHQLDRVTLQVKETEQVEAAVEVLTRLMKRRHYDMIDYEISVPHQLIKQQQKTKDIFNIVLGAIAGISLLVGGIGIMNIMLASVLERIKEIGLRLSLGATKNDILMQFVSEAVFISLTGGIIGVVLGVTFAKLITLFTGILTIVSAFSVVVSFLVAASIGLVFGITPARRAAEQDPITCLRYE